jgi:hypothetical protein
MRPGVRLPLPLSKRPHTLPILGKICQFEKRAERPHHNSQLFEREHAEPLREALGGSGVAVRRKPRGLANFFNQGKGRLASKAENHFAKEPAKLVNFTAELFVSGHGRSSFADA